MSNEENKEKKDTKQLNSTLQERSKQMLPNYDWLYEKLKKQRLKYGLNDDEDYI